MSAPTADALLTRYLVAGDETALEVFIDLTRPRLLAVARRIGAPQDAEDSVQSAYLSLLRMRGENLGAPALPWLVTAVVRIAYRRKAVQQRQVEIARRLAQPRETPLPLDVVVSVERQQALRALIARLPQRYRDPLALRHLEGLTVSEVAELLEVPQATVRTRIHRATRLIESRFPRALLFALVLPWSMSERSTLAAGGLLVSKNALTITGAVVLLGCLGATWTLWPMERGASTDAAMPQPTTEAQHESASTPSRAPSLAGQAGPLPSRVGDVKATATPFTGQVVDPTGKSVSGARVEVRGLYKKYEASEYFSPTAPPLSPLAEAPTDASGAFGFALRDDDDRDTLAVEVHVFADGWPPTVAKLSRDESVVVRLHPGGLLRLSVSRGGRPLEGAVARLVRGPGVLSTAPRVNFPTFLERTTSSDGVVAFDVPAGSYRARVQADELATEDTDALEVAAGGQTSVDVALTEGIVVLASVLDRSGVPIRGARVVVGGPFGTVREGATDESGACRLVGFAPPRSDAEFWDRCLYWRVLSEDFAPFQSSRRVPPEETEVRLDVSLEQGSTARLRFEDGTGAPVRGVRVTLVMDRNSANPLGDGYQPEYESGADGRVILRHLLPRPDGRPWRLSAHAPGRTGESYKSVYLEASSLRGDAPEQVVVIGAAEGSLPGRVLRPDGTPATSGRVGWLPADALVPVAVAWADIDPQGDFRLQGLTPATGQLVLRVDGFAPQLRPVESGAFIANAALSVRLADQPRIFGSVTTREGAPVANITLKLWQQYTNPKEGWHSKQEVAQARSDAEGRFAFLGAEEGTYTIAVVAEGLTRSLPWPREAKGSDQPLRLVLKPVSEGEGMPLVVRATVGGQVYKEKLSLSWKLNGQNYGAADPTRDDQGRYLFRIWTDPGSYDFELFAPGFRPYSARGVQMQDRPANPVVDVPLDRGATLRLRVRDGAGEPVRGQWLLAGNQSVRTDDHGECELGGLEPGARDVDVELESDRPFTGVFLKGVTVPGTVDIMLRRIGHVRVKILRNAERPQAVRVRLVGADGALVDEETVPTSKWAGRQEAWATLEVTAGGAYRLEASGGGQERQSQVHAAPGLATDVTVDFR